MTVYEMCLQLNRRLILGEYVSPGEKTDFINRVLRAVSSKEKANLFYSKVGASGICGAHGNWMYPFFLTPPYCGGRKLPTITGYRPKTHLVSANSYELELLRLTRIFIAEIGYPYNPEDMHTLTLSRLTSSSCFNAADPDNAESFEASLLVLRYLIPDAPKKEFEIRSRIADYRKHADDKIRPEAVTWYFRLCLSELPAGFVPEEISREIPLIQQTCDELYDAIGRRLTAMA